MNLLDSLLDAIVRLDGDALVMHVGEKPYVVTTSEATNEFRGPLAWGQVELSSRVLTSEAVVGMLGQILPIDQRVALDDYGATEYEVSAAHDPSERFTIVAARGGDDIWLELRRQRASAAPPAVAPAAITPEASEPEAIEPEAIEPEAIEPETIGAQPQPIAESAVPAAGDVVEPVVASPGDQFAADPAADPDVVAPDDLSSGLELPIVTAVVSDAVSAAEHEISLDAALIEPTAFVQADGPSPMEAAIEEDTDLTHLGSFAAAEIVAVEQEWGGDDVMTEGELGELLRASASAIILEETVGSDAAGPDVPAAAWLPMVTFDESGAHEITVADGIVQPIFAEANFDQAQAIELVPHIESDRVHAPAVEAFPPAVSDAAPVVDAPVFQEDAAGDEFTLVSPDATEMVGEPASFADVVAPVDELAPMDAFALGVLDFASTVQPDPVVSEASANVMPEPEPAAVSAATDVPAGPEAVRSDADPIAAEAITAESIVADTIASGATVPELDAAEAITGDAIAVEAHPEQIVVDVIAHEAAVSEPTEPEAIVAQESSPEPVAQEAIASIEPIAVVAAPATEAPMPFEGAGTPAGGESAAASEQPQPSWSDQPVLESAPAIPAVVDHAPVFEIEPAPFASVDQAFAAVETPVVVQEPAQPPVQEFAVMSQDHTPALPADLHGSDEPVVPQEPLYVEAAEGTSDAAAGTEDDLARRPAVVVPLARHARGESSADGKNNVAAALQRVLRLAAGRGATTVYVVAQSAPMVRVDGEFSALDGEAALNLAFVERLLAELAPQPRDGAASPPAEWITEVPEIGRVRCVTFRDHRGPGIIFRMVPARAIAAEQLGLPAEVQALCTEADGLILVAGGRGSGRSTLLNSFVDMVNGSRSDHVITVEPQIDFVHENKRSFVSQREVRGGGDGVAAAVRSAVREEPDVLVVEDVRTPELVSLALEAAESGRLVFASVPAISGVNALERLVEMFPVDRREKMLARLAGSLRGIVSQVLLRKLKGGRIAAREVLINTPEVAALIAEAKTSQLPAALENGRKHGMVSFGESLSALVRDGSVHPSHAYRKAPDQEQFLTLLRRDGVDAAIAERLA